MLWSGVLILGLLLAFKIAPPYFEFMTVNKQLKAVANDPGARGGARKDVENAFMNRAMIADIKSVSYRDIVVTKEGDGILLTVEYTVCVPVVSNIRACMDFAAASNK